jgi:hypothetical protein
MARIRTIKPEIWSSAQFVECSPTARLLFIGLWNFCDDQGVHPASLSRLKMEVFPGDSVSEKKLAAWVKELRDAKDEDGIPLVGEFTQDGKRYWFVTGFERHQKVEKPNRKYPSPPGNPGPVADQSENSSREVDDHSTPEGKGREGNVRESKGREGSSSRLVSSVNGRKGVQGETKPPPSPIPPEDFAALNADCIRANEALHFRDERDRDLIIRAAILARYTFDERWLWPCVESVKRRTVKHRGKYFHGALRRAAEKKFGVSHDTFSELFDGIMIPSELQKTKQRTEE